MPGREKRVSTSGVSMQARRRITSNIQGELWEWGEWVLAARCEGLSYPPVSVEGRMIGNGGWAPALFTSRIPRYFPNHKTITLNNRILELPEIDRQLLTHRYAHSLSYSQIAAAFSETTRYVGYNLERIHNILQKRN
jgi:hypothetical protein